MRRSIAGARRKHAPPELGLCGAVRSEQRLGCPAERAGGGSLERTRPARPAEIPYPHPTFLTIGCGLMMVKFCPSTARLSRARACGLSHPGSRGPRNTGVPTPGVAAAPRGGRPRPRRSGRRGQHAVGMSASSTCQNIPGTGRSPPADAEDSHTWIGLSVEWLTPPRGLHATCHCPSGRACCGTPWGSGIACEVGLVGS
jgi:hypothetical protein